MTEAIEIHDKMWIIADNDNLEFLGLKRDQVLRIKELKEILFEKNPKVDIGQEIRKLIINELIKEIDDETAKELGGLDYKEIKLSQLNADLIDNFIYVDCQITGEQSQKALVKSIVFECPDCAEQVKMGYSDNIELMIFSSIKEPNICKCGRKGKLKIVQKSYINFSVLFVRDLLNKQEKFTHQKYESKRIYIIGKELPKTKIVSIRGKVVIEPKTNDISIIADYITALKNQIEDFQVTEADKEQWKNYFGKNKELWKQINPDIVGEKRKLAKKATIAILHSPCEIYDIERKKIMRGGLNVVFIGDTKTGKSDIAKDITNRGMYEVGEYTSAETASRAGLLYTIDNEKNALIWGVIPLNDKGLVFIDGFQAMPSDEISQYREAIEQQEVIVNRSIKGNALARVRNLVCMNAGKGKEKPLSEYLYKCQAISDTWVFSKNADITRYDLFIPFSEKDVPEGEIAYRESQERDIPKEVFMRHIFWVWSRQPNDIFYTDSAVRTIKEASKELMDTYSFGTLPIVHRGVRDIITRLSVVKACELHSTNENHEKVIVDSEHVSLAVEFYKEVLDSLELEAYKFDIEGNSKVSDNELIEIAKELGNHEFNILNEIKHEHKSSTQLSSALDVSDRTIKEYYTKLKKYELIETKTGYGIGLTAKGIKFVKFALKGNSEIGKQKFTNNSNDEGLLHHFTNTPIGIEDIQDNREFDPKIIVNLNCSIKGCIETECNFGTDNKPYCKNHLR